MVRVVAVVGCIVGVVVRIANIPAPKIINISVVVVVNPINGIRIIVGNVAQQIRMAKIGSPVHNRNHRIGIACGYAPNRVGTYMRNLPLKTKPRIVGYKHWIDLKARFGIRYQSAFV